MACPMLANERAVFHWALNASLSESSTAKRQMSKEPPRALPSTWLSVALSNRHQIGEPLFLPPSPTPPICSLPLMPLLLCAPETNVSVSFVLCLDSCLFALPTGKRAETENILILAFPQEIAFLSALQNCKNVSFPCVEMGRPTGNI